MEPRRLETIAANGAPLELRRTRCSGIGVFATAPIAARQLLFRELPIVSAQLQREHTPGQSVCAACQRVCGTLEQQVRDLAAGAGIGTAHRVLSFPLAERCPSGAGAGGMFRCCEHGSCGAIYCSVDCRERSWRLHHAQLYHGGDCPVEGGGAQPPGAPPVDSPIAALSRLARASNNELLLPAAQLLAMCCNGDGDGGGGGGLSMVQTLRELVGAPWWDTLALSQAWRGAAQRQTEQALVLLRRALLPRALATLGAAAAEELLSLPSFARLLGVLRMNSSEFVVPSPLGSYFRWLSGALQGTAGGPGGDGDEEEEEEEEATAGGTALGDDVLEQAVERVLPASACLREAAAARQRAAEAVPAVGAAAGAAMGAAAMEHTAGEEGGEEGGEEERGEECLPFSVVFPAVAGIAVFALHSALNHHCLPNARVVFEDDETRARASVYAGAHGIVAGDEVCISYFGDEGEDLALGERQSILSEQYLFGCECTRCVAEKAAATRSSG